MSTSQNDENRVTKAKRKGGDDIEISVASSTTVKSVESTTAMDTSGKSDTHDTSGASVTKKPVKKKRKKTKTSQSPSPSPHKKMKKDPNKPEYPKVGMYKLSRHKVVWNEHFGTEIDLLYLQDMYDL